MFISLRLTTVEKEEAKGPDIAICRFLSLPYMYMCSSLYSLVTRYQQIFYRNHYFSGFKNETNKKKVRFLEIKLTNGGMESGQNRKKKTVSKDDTHPGHLLRCRNP